MCANTGIVVEYTPTLRFDARRFRPVGEPRDDGSQERYFGFETGEPSVRGGKGQQHPMSKNINGLFECIRADRSCELC